MDRFSLMKSIKSVTSKTIELDIDSNEDLDILDPNIIYYELVKPDQCQKPYFIWTCDSTTLDYILNHLKQAIEYVIIHEHWSIIMPEYTLITMEPQIYHLIVTNFYHPNGIVAQEFRDKVIQYLNIKSQKTITSLLLETKENPRTSIRNVAIIGPNIKHPRDDMKIQSLITYITGHILVGDKTVDESTSYYEWLWGYWNYMWRFFQRT
jgi:hypothetical protein